MKFKKAFTPEHRPKAFKSSHSDNDQRVMGTHAVKASLEHMPKRAIKLNLVEDNPRLEPMAALAKSKQIPIEFFKKHVFLEQFGDDVVHQGAVLMTQEFPYADLDTFLENPPNLCVILDGIEDPRNLGRAARSAFALGAQLLVIPKDRAACITAAAEKAAVGTLARLPVAQVTNLNRAIESLKEAGLWVIGTAEDAPVAAWDCDLTKPIALIIGNEEKGIRHLVAQKCDELVSIPMHAHGLSLNAADAATVLLYETLRQRSCAIKRMKA